MGFLEEDDEDGDSHDYPPHRNGVTTVGPTRFEVRPSQHERRIAKSLEGMSTELNIQNRLTVAKYHAKLHQSQNEAMLLHEKLSFKERMAHEERELRQFRKMEKQQKRLEARREKEEEAYRRRFWSSVVIFIALIQFVVPLVMGFKREPRAELCLLPAFRVGPFQSSQAACFLKPHRLGLGIALWGLFSFFRYFEIQTMQPLCFLAAMWFTDFNLIFASLILQAFWYAVIWVLRDYTLFKTHQNLLALLVVMSSLFTAIMAHSHISQYISHQLSVLSLFN